MPDPGAANAGLVAAITAEMQVLDLLDAYLLRRPHTLARLRDYINDAIGIGA